jgi:hypothetical protein
MRIIEVVRFNPDARPHDIPAMRVTLPSKSITDPDFDYRKSFNTDLRETFRRVRENRKQKTF